MIKLAFVLWIISFHSVFSLVCETCDGKHCYDKDHWVQEYCPPSTQFCYRLSSEGMAFRRGCSDYPCATLPGVEPGMECRTCSQDRCNNEKDNFFHQRGGGVSWRNGSNKGNSLLINASLLLCVTLFFGFC